MHPREARLAPGRSVETPLVNRRRESYCLDNYHQSRMRSAKAVLLPRLSSLTYFCDQFEIHPEMHGPMQVDLSYVWGSLRAVLQLK
jgi:hypothetical protein